MIVKWEDEDGQSFFDYVIHTSKLEAEGFVRVTQATLDAKLVVRDFSYGVVTVLSDKGVVIKEFNLGPKLQTGIVPEG